MNAHGYFELLAIAAWMGLHFVGHLYPLLIAVTVPLVAFKGLARLGRSLASPDRTFAGNAA